MASEQDARYWMGQRDKFFELWKAEEAAHKLTQGWLDRFQSEAASQQVRAIMAEQTLAKERAALEAENRRLAEAGETLWQELVESAFGWDLGLPDRVKADAQVALDGWRAALTAAASSEGRAATSAAREEPGE